MENIVVENPYSMLLDEEHRILEKTKNLREKIVDNFINENGLPTRSGDIRVLNEVMNSMDSNVTSTVELRLKHEENKQAEDLTEAIVEIFKNVNNKSIRNKENVPVTIDDKFVPDDVVPGEDQIEYQELDAEEILKKDK